jgi:hypothetical protein
MAPKDAFGVIVRTIGLISALYGIWYLAFGFAQATNLSEVTYPTADYIVGGATWSIVGVGLMIGSPLVERIAYR